MKPLTTSASLPVPLFFTSDFIKAHLAEVISGNRVAYS